MAFDFPIQVKVLGNLFDGHQRTKKKNIMCRSLGNSLCSWADEIKLFNHHSYCFEWPFIFYLFGRITSKGGEIATGNEYATPFCIFPSLSSRAREGKDGGYRISPLRDVFFLSSFLSFSVFLASCF